MTVVTRVRHGRAQERTIQCAAGQLKLRAPRVNDQRSGKKFTSRILPPYLRKSPRLEEALPPRPTCRSQPVRGFHDRANLSRANLSRAILNGAVLNAAILNGANLSGADLSEANLNSASYDNSTRWPEGFDPIAAGAILEE